MDISLLHPIQPVALFHSRQSMRDDDYRHMLTQAFDSFLYGLFGSAVKGGGSFIEYHELWTPIKSAGNGHALQLATGKAYATFADDGVNTVFQIIQKIHGRHAAAFQYALAVYLLSPLAESDVLCQAAIEQEGALWHIADTLHPPHAQAVIQFLPVHQHFAAAGRVQTRQQTDYGTLSRARRTDKTDHAPRGDTQADVLQGILAAFDRIGIAEAYVLKADLFLQAARTFFGYGLWQGLNFPTFLRTGSTVGSCCCICNRPCTTLFMIGNRRQATAANRASVALT